MIRGWWGNFGRWLSNPGYYAAVAKSGEKVSCGYKPGDFAEAKHRALARVDALNAEWDRMTDTEKLIHQNRLLLKLTR